MVSTIGSVRLKIELDRSDVRSGLQELRQIKAPNISIKPKVDLSELRGLKAIDLKVKADLSGVRRELESLIDKPIGVSFRADVRGIRRQLEALGDREIGVTIAAEIDTRKIDAALAKYADTTIKVKFDTSDLDRLQTTIKVGGGGDPVNYGKLTAAIEEGFKRGRPGGSGIISGTVSNVVRGAQEQLGASFTRKSSTSFVAQIEKEFSISLDNIGRQSAQRVAAVGKFAANRVATRVGERIGVEGGIEGFRAQVPKAKAFVREIIDEKAIQQKFVVLELSIGKFIDNLLDDALRLRAPTSAIKDAKNVAASVGDIAATPLEGIAARRQRNLTESYAEAERRSKFVTLPDLEGQKSATFTIGGFAGNQGQSSPGVADRLQTLLGDKSKAVPIANPQTDTSVNVGDGKLLFFGQILQRFAKQNVVDGKNDDAINAAATAIAAKRQSPDLKVGFAGYSAGGFVANEASQILGAGGIKAPAVGIGTPRLGLTDRLDNKNFKAIISDVEQLGKLTKLFNKAGEGVDRLDIAGDHKLSTYLGAPKAQKSILGQLGLDTNTPKELSGPAAFEIPSLDEDLNVTQTELARTLSDPKAHRFAAQSGIYKAYISNIQGNRDRIASLLETAQGETRDTLAQYDEAFQQAEELFKGAFGVQQPTKPPIGGADLGPKPQAVPQPDISDIPKSFIEESRAESNALLGALPESTVKARSSKELQGKIDEELKGKTTEILKEIGRVGGAGSLKGSKESIIGQLKEKVSPDDLARSIVSVEAITDIGPKGGQKLRKLPQTDNEKKLLDIALESEQRIKQALIQLNKAQGARREQIAESIANESAQTTALLNRITSKSVAPETRLEAGQIKGRLSGIDKQLPTISGTARIRPSEVLGKVPKGAIADAGVALAGVAVSQIGAQLGIGGELLGSLAGSLAARQGVEIGKAIARATSTLKASGQSVTPKSLLKQSQVEFLSRNAQKEMGRNLTGDIAGFAIGNAATKAADLMVPGSGAVVGLTAALTGTPKVQSARDRFLDRQQPQEIEGLARVSDDKPTQGIGGRLKARAMGLFKSKRLDAERVYQILLEETAKASGVALNPRDIPSLKVDDSRLKQLGAVGFYKIKDNQVLIEKALSDSISGTIHDAEKAQKALLTLVHESRHALQFDFGRLSIADIGKDNTQSPVALFSPNNVDRSSQYNAARSTQIAKQQNPLASKALLGGIYRTEADAYAFEKVKGSSVVDRTLDRLKAGEGRADKFALPKIELPKGLKDIAEASRNARSGVQSLERGFDSLVGAVTKINGPIGGFIGSLKGLGPAAISAFAIGQIAPRLAEFGKESVDAAVQYDRLRTSLSNSSGSARAADRDLAFVDKQASTFGTDLKSGREGFTGLRASTKGTGVEGKATEDLFTGLTQASTVLGLSQEKQSKAFLALEQTASKGKLSAEELRGQLAEALPGAFGVAARAIGVTESELNKLLETGAITSDEFLPKFGRQLKAEFGGSAVEASNNLQSSLFRTDAALLKLKESSGAGIAPAVKLGADAATGALGLLNQSIGVVGPALALMALNIGVGVGGSLLKVPGVAKAAAGALVGLKEAGLAVGKSLGPVALQFIAVQAAIELFGAAKDMFGLTEEGQRFKQLADTATKEIDRINGKLDEVKTKSVDRSPSKGVDLTFGVGGAIGVGAVRTDDVLKQSEKTGEKNSLLDRGLAGAANISPAVILNKLVTKLRGGEGVTTIGDLQKQRDGFEFDKFETSLFDRAGIGFNSAPISESLRATKAIDDKSKDLRSQRNILAAQPGKTSEVAAIDTELKALGKERESAFKASGDAQGAVAGALREARGELKSLEDKGTLTDTEKARVDRLKQSIGILESSQKNIDKLGVSIGTTGDATRKLVTTLADLEDKLASIEERANLTLNIKLASNARESLAEFGGNQFAGADAAVKDAKAQGEKAKAVFEQTRSEIEKAQKDLGGDDVGRELGLINVGATGRKLSLDSSEEDLKTAAKGATPAQKDLIERVDSFRKTRAKLPTLDRDAAQSELAEKQTTQAAALARVDDKSELRNQASAKSSSDRQIALNKELVGNTIKSDEDLAIKRAALEKQSVADRASAVKAQIGSLDELKSQGVISAEEYIKRRRALASEEISIATDASNAEVSIKQAANAKILKDLERATRDRNLKSKITSNDAQIQLTKDDLNPNISEEKLAVKSAEVGLDGTRSELSNAKADLEGLNKAFAAGALNQEAYNDQAAQLKGTISDLGVKQAQGELAVRKAINAELLKQFERAKATRELDARIGNNEGRKALIGRQLSGGRKLEAEDVAIESAGLDLKATDRQAANASADLADLNTQFARGLIKVGEFEDKSKELKGTLSDLSLQKATNELAILEAQNAKTLKSFERLSAEANAKSEVKQFTRSFGAKQSQFRTGEVSGLGGAAEQSKVERDGIADRIRLRTGEIAGIKRLVQQRVLTESEGRDRILGIESDIRSQRSALLDSQIAEYERVTQGKIDAINRVADAEVAAFEAEKSRLSARSTLLEKQSSLLSAQSEQEKAVSDARVGSLSSREAGFGTKRGLAAKLKDEGTGANEKREVLRQTGGASELTLLKNQQAIAREIEAEKVASLDRQQAFARQQLEQEQARLRIAQKIAEIEAKSAQIRAVAASATAKLELSKAERTGDKNQIDAAKGAVAAADLGVALASENVGLVKESGAFQEKELAVRSKTLGIQQNAERADLVRGNRSAEDARRLDFAQTLDRTGEKGFVGNYAVAGEGPRGEVKVEPIADSMSQLSASIGAINMPGLEALLKIIAENTAKGQGPTNNFNGGQDSIQQYIALQQAQQASKARR